MFVWFMWLLFPFDLYLRAFSGFLCLIVVDIFFVNLLTYCKRVVEGTCALYLCFLVAERLTKSA